MDSNDRGQAGEIGLLLMLVAVGAIPIVGSLLSPGWNQGEVGLGVLVAGFASYQLVGGLWAWCWGLRARGEDQPPRSRSL